MKRTRIKRKTRLKLVSERRRKDMATYKTLRECFLRSNRLDAAWLKLDGYSDGEIHGLQQTALITLWEGNNFPAIYARSNEQMILKGLPQRCPGSGEIHHAAKRGKNYLDVATWIAVSRPTHLWIEANKAEARRSGLLTY